MRGQCARRSRAAGHVVRHACHLERTTFVIRPFLPLVSLAALAVAAMPLAAGGGDGKEESPTGEAAKTPAAAPPKAPEPPEEPPVVTKHELHLGERTLRYDVTT